MATLLTVGLIGSFIAVVTAIHLRLTARPPEPIPFRTTDDIDAEFFRIIDREWRRDIRQPR
jgi:hypothetical protein